MRAYWNNKNWALCSVTPQYILTINHIPQDPNYQSHLCSTHETHSQVEAKICLNMLIIRQSKPEGREKQACWARRNHSFQHIINSEPRKTRRTRTNQRKIHSSIFWTRNGVSFPWKPSKEPRTPGEKASHNKSPAQRKMNETRSLQGLLFTVITKAL